ncbi:hypothetical protein J7K42_02765 [bacterium]|nr:hypothetical protein [bacterium]
MKDSTIQIIGEENFLKICRKFSLAEKEIEILKKILKNGMNFQLLREQKKRIFRNYGVGLKNW